MSDAQPSPEAANALRESEARLEESRRLMQEPTQLLDTFLDLYVRNHFAERVGIAFGRQKP